MGTPYLNMVHDKVRNYVIWHNELGQPLAPIYEHFVSLDPRGMTLREHLETEHSVNLREIEQQRGKPLTEPELDAIHRQRKLSGEEWQRLIADPVNVLDPRAVKAKSESTRFQTLRPEQPPPGATLDQIFTLCATVKRDMDEHLPKLRDLASQCEHVTEFTKRRESTAGLLAGRPKTLVSYQKEHDALIPALLDAVGLDAMTEKALASGRKVTDKFTVTTGPAADSLEAQPIGETDLLFFDSVHHGDRLYGELSRHATQVRKWIVLRGTQSYGAQAEGGGPGLMLGWARWQQEHPEWKRVYHAQNQYGLTVFSRLAHERSIDQGPGSELKAILKTLGIEATAACDCNAKAAAMDQLGPIGCREKYDEILTQLREGAPRWKWSEKLAIAAKAVASGLAFQVDWGDPLPGLLTLAIQRSEEKESA